MILLPGEFVLIVVVIMMFAEGLISYDEGRRNFVFLFKPYLRSCHHVPGNVSNISGARYSDSSKSYSSHEVCILTSA